MNGEAAPNIKLIVGLGNPGSDYANTRHNVGFALLDLFAQRHGIEFKEKKKLKGDLAQAHLFGKTLYLLKPSTYMNLSGEAVQKTAHMYRIAPEEVLVVTDDVNLPIGEMRLKEKGSSGGHNGLKSIASHLGGENYPRLRIGVSAPKGGELASFVLGRFKSDELEALEETFETACTVLEGLIKECSYKDLMQVANKRRRQDRDNEKKQEDQTKLGDSC